jgi:uncharacterized hydrophobic protein (TIGR00271 family)
MNSGPPRPLNDGLAGAADALRALFSLKNDSAADTEIDDRLRTGVSMQGTNLWVLMFAIFIASIGLNVNSTAVIIGAMLISPLMGPIMGVGYGVGILDLALIRRGLKNLAIATLIGLLTSTAYFLLSPLRGATSELLARTSPSIWDVLIALFGGLAGIVGVTRKQPSNVIPGVAIATALMPPLCTAGYGLATGHWGFALGAFYLFSINCVFIATSSALVIRAFHVQRKQFVDAATERRVRFALGIIVVATLVPSFYLAYKLVGEEVFRSRATLFVNQQLERPGTHVTDVNVDAGTKRIDVSLVGAVISKSDLTSVMDRLSQAGLIDANLRVFQTGDQHVDVATLRASVVGDLYNRSQAALVESTKQLQQIQAERDALKTASVRFKAIPEEIHTLYPTVSNVLVADALEWDSASAQSDRKTVVVIVRSRKPLSRRDRERLEQWVRARTKAETAHVISETG